MGRSAPAPAQRTRSEATPPPPPTFTHAVHANCAATASPKPGGATQPPSEAPAG